MEVDNNAWCLYKFHFSTIICFRINRIFFNRLYIQIESMFLLIVSISPINFCVIASNRHWDLSIPKIIEKLQQQRYMKRFSLKLNRYQLRSGREWMQNFMKFVSVIFELCFSRNVLHRQTYIHIGRYTCSKN